MENGKCKNLRIFGVRFFHASFEHPLSVINLNMFLVLLEFTATSCSSMDSGEKGSNSYIPKYVWMNLWRAGYYFPEHSLSMDLNTNETNEYAPPAVLVQFRCSFHLFKCSSSLPLTWISQTKHQIMEVDQIRANIKLLPWIPKRRDLLGIGKMNTFCDWLRENQNSKI